jgi:predicted membrane chloride channel (bestrophin family)
MVTETHVRDLLESSLDDAQLILELGQLSVVDGAAVANDPSALVVATADELREQHDVSQVNDEQLTSIAALLDDRISKLGA